MTSLLPRLGIIAVLAVACMPGVVAQTPAAQLKAGAATANITPPLVASIVGGWAPFPATYIHDSMSWAATRRGSAPIVSNSMRGAS